MTQDSTVTLRLSSALLAEAEELLPKLKTDPRYRSTGRLSRASVLRLALDMGLHSLRVHLATADTFEGFQPHGARWPVDPGNGSAEGG